jgi:hypothetical protein
MATYVGQRGQFGDNYGSQREAKNVTKASKICSRFSFTWEGVIIIVHEMNLYAE